MLASNKDPMGLAIRDYHQSQDESLEIQVFSDVVTDDVIAVPYLFRTFDEWPVLEQKAISYAKGKVLDIGAGAGVHSKELQSRSFDVTALEWSPLACEIMKASGIEKVSCQDLYHFESETGFDTIFLLMNGLGLAGTVAQLPLFLQKLKSLLSPDGQIILDSSDVRFLFEEEDGSMYIDLNGKYYGEMNFTMEYKGVQSKEFPWIYLAADLLEMHAENCGFDCEILAEGDHYDYLARLTPKSDG